MVEGLESGEFPLAALVMPATVDHIKSISEHSERMPAKSTYFYPKLLSGWSSIRSSRPPRQAAHPISSVVPRGTEPVETIDRRSPTLRFT